MIEFSPERARRSLLVSMVSVGMGFTVLFPILAPLGREIGLSEIQITSIIGASAPCVLLASPIRGPGLTGRARCCGSPGVSVGRPTALICVN